MGKKNNGNKQYSKAIFVAKNPVGARKYELRKLCGRRYLPDGSLKSVNDLYNLICGRKILNATHRAKELLLEEAVTSEHRRIFGKLELVRP